MLFNELNIIQPILKALKAQGYQEATPIQIQAIPSLLEGSDLLGCAQTGTGKTAAFAIPILQKLAGDRAAQKGQRKIKALIVAPTRELALQISDSFNAYGANLDQRTTVIFGGVPQNPQTRQLQRGVDILVATPGRLLDLIHQGFIDLGNVEQFVLDEADQMLDMGMLQDVKRIIKYIPTKRQTMFFSATMPTEIGALADTILKDPVKIEIRPEFSPIDIIEQEVYFVDKKNKTNLLVDLLKGNPYDSVLVFSRTKHGADRIVKDLNRKGFVSAAIHGNKSQNNRQLALSDFKKRKTRILVATDIAARGLDIEELSHVINYNLPEVP
ncbi:MAG: DEAD/DEAH box helicase, partial [Eubacteriales bacterium]|nr:DEAD/DEAH box helicase [Eubacteriales bacterium]